MSVFTDAVGGALGASGADIETVDLIEQIIVNEVSGKSGVPSFGGGGGGGGGFAFAGLRPYLRLYLYQQENPWLFPVVGGVILSFFAIGVIAVAKGRV
jgi:hypothetical protein